MALPKTSRTRASARAEAGCQNCGWAPAPGQLWPTYGPMAVRWMQANAICGEGDYYGQLIKLRPDQKRFVYRWYEYCPGCDHWRYGEAIRTEATGGGKTTFVAALVALEFAGPPEISPASPNIIISAASFKQANLLYGITATMFGGRDESAKESPLCGFFEVYDTKIGYMDGRPGKVERIAAADGTNEGGGPTLFVGDEMHEWGDVGSNKARVHTVVGKSTKKRNCRHEIPQKDGTIRVVHRGPGRLLSLSTAGFDIQFSLFGQMVTHARSAEHDPAKAPRLLFDHFEAPPGLDYENPEHRRIAVVAASPAAGVLWDIQSRVDDWGTPLMPKHEWIRYYANTWVEQAADSWLSDHPGAWAACKGSWQEASGQLVVMAVDMALKHDSVAVTKVRLLPDERMAVTSKIWYPRDGSNIDHAEVFAYITAEATTLGADFAGLVYDPRFFQLPALALEDEGFLIIEMPQSPERMAPAVGLTYDMVIAGTIVHDGDPDLASQVAAAAKRAGERGFTLSKGRSKRHIDAAVSMCMGVWTLAELSGQMEPNASDVIW